MNIEKYILVVNKGNMIEASKARRHERATEEERNYIYIFLMVKRVSMQLELYISIRREEIDR